MSEETKGGCQVWVRGPWWLLVVGEGIKVELSVAEGPQLMNTPLVGISYVNHI